MKPKGKTLERTEAIDKAIAEQVKLLRVERGLSQTQLGEAVMITFQQVQKYEHGTNRISSSRLWQFANILRVTDMNYFFKGLQVSPDNPAETLTDPARVEIDTQTIKLSALMNRVPPPLRRKIIALVKEMAGGDDD